MMATTVALVGYGYWGPNLLRNYMEIPGADVKWICDTRRERLDEACARYPSLRATTDFEQVLNDDEVQAVVIATPIPTHHPLGKRSLEAGKHTFIEKPMTVSSGQAVELVDLADKRGLTLMVGHTFVYSPPVRKVKELLDQGEIGDVLFITSTRVNTGSVQKGFSVLWDMAPHDLSIIYYWLGEMAGKVHATARGCVECDNPDVAFLRLCFGSGVVASVDVAWLSPVKLRRTVLVGSRRMLVYDDMESVEKIRVYDHGTITKEAEKFGGSQASYGAGGVHAPELEAVEPLFAEASHFIDCVVTGSRPITDGVAGLQVVSMLEAADDSLRNGGLAGDVRAAEALQRA